MSRRLKQLLSIRWLLPYESILLTDAVSALVFLLEDHLQTLHHREWSVGKSDSNIFFGGRHKNIHSFFSLMWPL